ncbi:SMI1/KNR4 family protein [Metabacillus fastidiosus]|uniref:SMI1/KNR4 family protein n=1 Tax=Metabacillus fastidiosus TaxID=1458 RepID=A0ABU6NYX7_9BACI|nr:SMI1/KNR4 family protein [Metabacillus fastidiosus]MED4401582.1 SMI1/KNR4 family protein [Metabacillus fastidiosus]MED4463217.1 SMI1/KNR4 family protein [Metabacillus fastidiosus]
MNKETVIALINNASTKFFIGTLEDSKISSIEKMLHVKLPESYKWFLREYGTGGIVGIEILGGGLREVPTCVRETEEWRKYGLPPDLVVIQNYGVGVYCLDTSRLVNNECPVIDWERDDEGAINEYENFYTFLIEKFSK